MSREERLVLVHSSMKYSLAWWKLRSDARDAFALAERNNAAMIGFSEVQKNSRAHKQVKKAAREAGWSLQNNIRGDSRFAVSPNYKIRYAGSVGLLKANTGMPKGNYGRKNLAIVKVETPEGNIVTNHTTHWLTGYRLGRKGNRRRERRYEYQTKVLIDRVKKNGKGDHLSFWQGDTNIDEVKDRGRDKRSLHHQLESNGLRSVNDSLKKYPNTHGRRTIDIIGYYKKDARVSPKNLWVVPFKSKRWGKRYSDHKMVVAVFHIAPKK